MILESLIFMIMAIEMQALFDSEEIKEGRWIKHVLETIIIAMVMFFESWAAFGWTTLALCNFITFWPIRWLLFDISLNLMRGLPWDYLSKPSDKASKLDMLLDKVKKYQYVVKLLTFGIVILLDYLILTK